MHLKQLHILLADDDIDDCMFFRQAVDNSLLAVNLTAVHDGEQLMQYLKNENHILPHALFLDLNMPRKNGFECLSEIKGNEKLKQLPIIIFSTSFEQGVVDRLYLQGARYFIRKPVEFTKFKMIIYQTLALIASEITYDTTELPEKENFVIVLEK